MDYNIPYLFISFVPKEFLNKRICIYRFYFMRDEKSFINIGMK